MTAGRQLAEAIAASEDGRLDEAAALFDAVLAVRPEDPAALEGRGLLFYRAGDHAAAAALLARAAAAARHDGRIHYHLGLALQALDRLDAAEAAYRQAAALRPADADTLGNLGNLLAARGDLPAALAVLGQATRLAPQRAELWTNLGVARQQDCWLEGAIAAHRRAIALMPQDASYHYNLGLALLQAGQFAEGWAEYEWRWKAAEFKAQPRPFVQPRWRGEKLAGRSLLVWGEQGIGDEILYAGMLPGLAGIARDLIVECAPRLLPLFRRSFPFAAVVPATLPPDRATDTDLQVPMPSLGGLLRARIEDFPSPGPYLHADAAQVRAIRDRAPRRGPHIGLSWASHAPGRAKKKTLPLVSWAPILVPARKADLVSLQYGPVDSDLAALHAASGIALRRDAAIDPLVDLDGLAAQIAGLDLVITVSNTTAHLAGALGVPCWVLVPTGGGQIWYWFQDREDSPFYPTMRFFRQTTPGDWTAAADAAAAALAGWISGAGRG